MYVPPADNDSAEVKVKTPFGVQPLRDILPVSSMCMLNTDTRPGTDHHINLGAFIGKCSVITFKKFLPSVLRCRTFFCIAPQIAKVVFKQNFGAMVLSLACVAMGIHADLIRSTFDGCPVSVFVGKSGRGKTYSLKMGLAVLGKYFKELFFASVKTV